jgi:hypothetical protein
VGIHVLPEVDKKTPLVCAGVSMEPLVNKLRSSSGGAKTLSYKHGRGDYSLLCKAKGLKELMDEKPLRLETGVRSGKLQEGPSHAAEGRSSGKQQKTSDKKGQKRKR